MVIDRFWGTAGGVGVVEIFSEDVVVIAINSVVVPYYNVLWAQQGISWSQSDIVVLHELLTDLSELTYHQISLSFDSAWVLFASRVGFVKVSLPSIEGDLSLVESFLVYWEFRVENECGWGTVEEEEGEGKSGEDWLSH